MAWLWPWACPILLTCSSRYSAGVRTSITTGALSALRDAGKNVPRDIGLLGVNDMEMAGWNGIDLTTIRQPIKEIVTASLDQVGSMLNDPTRAPEARLFACSVIERATLLPPVQT